MTVFYNFVQKKQDWQRLGPQPKAVLDVVEKACAENGGKVEKALLNSYLDAAQNVEGGVFTEKQTARKLLTIHRNELRNAGLIDYETIAEPSEKKAKAPKAEAPLVEEEIVLEAAEVAEVPAV